MRNPTCKKCGGSGTYMYDNNHGKICELCCPHDQGWHEVTEGFTGYKKGADNAVCKAGCGTMRRDIKND